MKLKKNILLDQSILSPRTDAMRATPMDCDDPTQYLNFLQGSDNVPSASFDESPPIPSEPRKECIRSCSSNRYARTCIFQRSVRQLSTYRSLPLLLGCEKHISTPLHKNITARMIRDRLYSLNFISGHDEIPVIDIGSEEETSKIELCDSHSTDMKKEEIKIDDDDTTGKRIY